MEAMEQKVTETVEIETPLGILPLNIGGTIDRMDSKDDTLRIVDYKTGGTPRTPENIAQLFVPADNRPLSKWAHRASLKYRSATLHFMKMSFVKGYQPF